MIIYFGRFPLVSRAFYGGLIINFGFATQGSGGAGPVVATIPHDHPFFTTMGKFSSRR